MTVSIIRQIIELEHKSSDEIRTLYQSLFGKPCHRNATRDQLRPKIAYRLQELYLDDGLIVKNKQKLEVLSKSPLPTQFGAHSDLVPGTKICREYKNAMHEVEVLKDGFEYRGQKWRSLSAIATAITGTKWNGPKFFKLRT